MNQQISSQQQHTMSSSSGSSQVVQQSYQVQQKHESFQQQYSGQQPVRMQQQYQVNQQQSSHQGYGQPGQTQRIVQDSSTVKSQEYVTKGQQFLPRGPQQPQQQNPAFESQFPGHQQYQQPSQQQFQQNTPHGFSNQPQPLRQQPSQAYSSPQVDPSNMEQIEDDFLRKPTKKLSQWPPQQEYKEKPKQFYETGAQGLASWPPPQDAGDSNQVQFEPNKLGQIYTEMPTNQPYQSQQPTKNIGKLDANACAPQFPQQNQGLQQNQRVPQQNRGVPQQNQGLPQQNQGLSQQNQGVPQQFAGHPQTQQGRGAPQRAFDSPGVGGFGQGANNPQGMNIKSGINPPSGFVPNPSSAQGRGQTPNQFQGTGFGQNPNNPQGGAFAPGLNTSNRPGIILGSHNPQGAGYIPGASNPQRPGYGQMSNNPHGTVNGQGPMKQQNLAQPPQSVPQGGIQANPQLQPTQEGPERYAPLDLPRGTVQDQKTYFDKPHQYDPTQCDVGIPYGDGNLPEWPPKNAGGPNMTMTYPSAYKLRDEAPIDHQTLPVSAPSQPAFKLTTPIRKSGDEVWPPRGSSTADEPTTDVRDFSRPTKSNKGYDSFFAANMIPNNYPGYRAPPGTQHVGFMEDAQPL